MSEDARRRALMGALVERDLYRMLGVAPQAPAEEVSAAVARRREEVQAARIHPQERRVEAHWLDWAERVLADPALRAEYDGALAAEEARERAGQAAREQRRALEREVMRRRDEIARREEERAATHVQRPAAARGAAAPAPAKPRRAARATTPTRAVRLTRAREDAALVESAEEAITAMAAAAEVGDAEAVTALGERAVKLAGEVPTLLAVADAHRRVGDDEPAADGSPWSAYAAALRRHGDLGAAREAAQHVVDARPGLGHAWATLGAILADLGDDEAAERALAEAVRLGPQRSAPLTRLRALRDRHQESGDAAGAARVDAHLRRLGVD
jgi:Flp pilus assembly protein TadD